MQMPSAPTKNLGRGLTASESSSRARGHSPSVSRQYKPSINNDGFSERGRLSSEIEQSMMDIDHQNPTPKSASSSSAHKVASSPRVSTGTLSLQSLCAASEMLDGSSPTSEASNGRKRRIPPGPGLRWCAGGSGGGGRWIDASDEAAFGLEAFDKFPPARRPRHEDPTPPNSSVGIKPLSIRPKHRVIGNGIFISGGRVMMNDSTSGEEKITVCTFCRRSFISSHALDVHLSRNQVRHSGSGDVVIFSEIIARSHVETRRTKLKHNRSGPRLQSGVDHRLVHYHLPWNGVEESCNP